MGLLTLGCTSAGQEVAASNGVSWNDVSLGDQGARAGLDFCFTVASADPMVVQETHETLYHVLWELVHIFFEHEGLLV